VINNNNGLQYMTHMGERTGAYLFLMGKPERQKSLGRPRRKWEVNIKMNV
jgi:S-ribosylhomocysteine lyase LuxS involved in autoinducer biosynthesis